MQEADLAANASASITWRYRPPLALSVYVYPQGGCTTTDGRDCQELAGRCEGGALPGKVCGARLSSPPPAPAHLPPLRRCGQAPEALCLRAAGLLCACGDWGVASWHNAVCGPQLDADAGPWAYTSLLK